MGGRGNFGSRNTGTRSNSEVLKVAQDYVSNHLSSGEQFATATKAEIVGEIDENGMADVKVEYETRVRIAVGYDAELQRMEYENDTEYHTDTFRMKVGNTETTSDNGYKEWLNANGYEDSDKYRQRYESVVMGRAFRNGTTVGTVRKATPVRRKTHSKYRA